jgi:dihydrofolate synthase/folylpolyglutamate synthase
VDQPGSFNSLSDWLPWLETLSPREIVLGLERVHQVLDRLDLARPSLVISIAGTNGKGSSAAMLEALLARGGARTGCYTSPHINRYNERIRIDGKPAPDEVIVAALALVEAVRGDVPLTFFEFGTIAALVAFDSANADAWVLEVGLGGRLDAVNAIEPDASLITNVSLDHCAWLGDDTESIAIEKAGIMRASRPVVFGSTELPAAIPAMANKLGAALRVAGRDFSFTESARSAERWSWQGQRIFLSDLKRPALPGRIQLQNAAAVLAVLESLNLDHLLTGEIVSEALSGIWLDGRFQIIDKSCRWIFDVAHNPGAAIVLAELLREHQRDGKITAVVGMLADKDIAGVIAPLADFVDQWIAVTVAGSRAESAHKLAAKIANASAKPCVIAESTNDGLQLAEARNSAGDTVLVAGSFYLVGPALEWLRSR